MAGQRPPGRNGVARPSALVAEEVGFEPTVP